MKDEYLRKKGLVVLFAAHGNGTKKVQAALGNNAQGAAAALIA